MARQRDAARKADPETVTPEETTVLPLDSGEESTEEPAEGSPSTATGDKDDESTPEDASLEPSIEDRIRDLREFIQEGEERMELARAEIARLELELADSTPAPTLLDHISHSRRITEALRGGRGASGGLSLRHANERRRMQATQKGS